ncbi:uncharacterized protein At4g22758-like isoform X2 [Telopea speciosissima]|uniref:uncharacterized protein At4g22758-like isoform X1 n=1 Tax=Telopea speciosissima TaxID=54955 RepID=UPI001CC6FAFD|nr:uncharacterized protein At4g22758-like isoform X1 [Telopea speciosissima]XP_043703457.1 uncharacterized protein At4g22758-like isoform X2 [Telopea speciosissima]
MPSPSKSGHRRGNEENGRGKKLGNRAASFHGRAHLTEVEIRRPKTVPNLLSAGKLQEISREMPSRLTKLLLNVTIQRSFGAVQVVMSPELMVGDLIVAAVRLYAKEGRRPLLPTTDPSDFDLHYSQFSLESLNREEKLKELGSRNFFLCPKKPNEAAAVLDASCSNQAQKVSKISIPWLRFMDFLL